jgi:outer membrane immunogenic protein
MRLSSRVSAEGAKPTNEGVMKTLLGGILVAAIVVIAQSAAAADLGGGPRRSVKDAPYPPPYYERPFSWTGLYVGAHLGYGWSNQDWQFDLSSVSTGHDGHGSLAGGQIGYNIQVNQFVYGIEADASGAWLDGGTACPSASFNCSHSYDWIATLRGRAGIAINNNRTLLYATAGVAWADINYAAKDAATGVAFGTGFSERHTGYVVGGGVEHMLGSNLSARLEYLYYGFNDATAPAGSLGAGAASLDPSAQVVRFGVNLKF